MMKAVRVNGARAAAASSGPVLPYTSGLQLWFKADSIVASDGDAVTTWADSSGNGYDVSQSVAGEKPTYKTGILNGKPVVRFDGGDLLYRATTALGLRTHTMFAVFRESSTVTSAGIINLYAAGAGSDYDSLDAISYDTGNNSFYMQATSPGLNMTVGSSGASPWGVYASVMGGGTATVYQNGSAGTTDASYSEPDVNSAGGFILGGHWISGAIYAPARLNGDIAEILWYSSNLSASNRQLVERYLGAKYGITVA